MVSLLWALMTTTKLVDVVWVEIISMEILQTDVLPILITIMQLLFTEMLPFLSLCSKKPLVISAVNDALIDS